MPASAEFDEYQGIAESIEQDMQARMDSSEYTADEAYYVSHVDLTLCKKELRLSDERLEKLRQLCQLWDIDLRHKEITSHRKFVGPVIVFAKKRIYPLFRFFLKDLIHQQQRFNATAIALIADLSSEDIPEEETH
jgi:hypothetical protein